ncbi:MAG: recombinase family protein [Candidatus Sedimenticola sp. PURPLELP]
MKIAIYTRVSTDKQTTDNQLQALEEWAARAGHDVVQVYDDNGISGAKGRESRKALDGMLKAAVRREFDMVAAWSVDRLGRSLTDLLHFMTELQSVGCDLYLHQQALDTSTPAGKAMFQMCGVFAEFERAMIRERVKAGLARAKAKGKRLGRPKASKATERAILTARAKGLGIRKIASEVGCGVSVVQRVIQDR